LFTGMFRMIGARRIVRVVLERIVHEPDRVDDAQVRGYAEPLSARDSARCLLAMARSIRPRGLSEIVARYPTLEIPTLLIWGRSDRVVPLPVGERLAKDLPRSHLVVLERCGHLPAEELPDESYAAVAGFLDDATGVTADRG
jgi:pimeloyl-ACP methyl ester carboxylesterase